MVVGMGMKEHTVTVVRYGVLAIFLVFYILFIFTIFRHERIELSIGLFLHRT